MDKGDQLYGDEKKLNFWWCAHCNVYRIRKGVIKMMEGGRAHHPMNISKTHLHME